MKMVTHDEVIRAIPGEFYSSSWVDCGLPWAFAMARQLCDIVDSQTDEEDIARVKEEIDALVRNTTWTSPICNSCDLEIYDKTFAQVKSATDISSYFCNHCWKNCRHCKHNDSQCILCDDHNRYEEKGHDNNA